MKHLAILRHAKSRWDDEGLDDFNRPLTDRGWTAAKRIGRELEERETRFDLVLASPAARVRETIDGLQETFRFTAPIRFQERMYLASLQLLLAMARELPESVHRPLFIGHNPGLQQLLLDLAGDDEEGLRDRIAGKFPTCAFAVVQLPARRWDQIESGTGSIVELIRPRDLH